MISKTTWQAKTFTELSLNQLYDLLKLRVDIFVVEQTCFYPDLDGEKDQLDRHPNTLHLLGYQGDKLVGYLRVLPKGQSYPNNISIGRVVIAVNARGCGLGHELMAKGISLCHQYFPSEVIKISAQQHLRAYYHEHGFSQVSDMYLEDGIPHIAMLRDNKQ